VFGSATRSDFDEQSSDVDLLVQFEDMPYADRADAYLGFLTAAEELLQRHVDLVEVDAVRTCIGESRNRESSSMPRDPRAWLADIVVACDLLIEFTT
jgi:predicted nucleotidyltransferase